MTVHEIHYGNGVSGVGSISEDADDYTRGYAYGHAAARRGQPVNPTIHRLSKTFRTGYLDGYDLYRFETRRFYRLDTVADSDD